MSPNSRGEIGPQPGRGQNKIGPQPADLATGQIFKHCGEEGHHIRDCPVRLKARKKKDTHNDSEEEDDEECGYCNRRGHTEEECYTKQRAMKKKNSKKKDEDKDKDTKDEDAAEDDAKPEGKALSAQLISELHQKIKRDKECRR